MCPPSPIRLAGLPDSLPSAFVIKPAAFQCSKAPTGSSHDLSLINRKGRDIYVRYVDVYSTCLGPDELTLAVHPAEISHAPLSVS